MIDPSSVQQPFDSLAALRQASDLLLKELPEDESSISATKRGEISKRIQDFVGRAVATGAVLDISSDRMAGQGLIDFWVAKSYSLLPRQALKEQQPRASVQLKQFDPAIVESAISKGEAVFDTLGGGDDREWSRSERVLARITSFGDKVAKIKIRGGIVGITGMWGSSPKLAFPFKDKIAEFAAIIQRQLIRLVPIREKEIGDRKIARRILLRMVRLLDTEEDYVTAPVRHSDLLSISKPERVDHMLDALREAGILNVAPGGVVSLRYDTLTSHWDRLRDWIEKRINFRAAATSWERTGRRARALLTGTDANEALAEYADLNPLELAYISQSASHSRRLTLIMSAIGAILLIAVGAGLFQLGEKLWHEHKERVLEADAKKILSSDSLEEQEKLIRKLEINDKPLKLQKLGLIALNLTNIHKDNMPAVDEFIESIIQAVDLTAAALPYALFSRAFIIDTNFSNTDLTLARFDDATIRSTSTILSTKFIGATLHRTLFDRAKFVGEVDFTNSDLESASFRNVDLRRGNLKLAGTAWWLAAGWTFDQIQKLLPKGDASPDLQDASFFKNRIKDEERALVRAAADPVALVRALNGLAWTYAIYGTDLKTGDNYAKQAVAAFEKIKEKGRSTESKANLVDTQAYIALQLGNASGAVSLLKDIDETLKRAGSNGEFKFRYAVALHALAEGATGDEKSKLEKDASDLLDESLRGGYVPTHELYLLRRYITGDFNDKIRALLKSTN